MLALIQAVRHKTGIEIHKILAFTFFDMTQIYGFEHPHASLTFKIIFLYHTRFQINPLHLYGFQRSVAHHVHVALTVEKQCIIILFGKQVVVLPEAFLYLRRSVPVVIRQRKLRPCPLQSLVRSIVEDKIVKQFVRFQRLRLLLHFCLLQRIGFMPGRIHHFGNGSKGIHFRLSVPTREQKDEYKKSR